MNTKKEFNFFSKRGKKRVQMRGRLTLLAVIVVLLIFSIAAFTVIGNSILANKQKQVDELQAYVDSDSVKQKLEVVNQKEAQLALLEEYRKAAVETELNVKFSHAGGTAVLNMLTSLLPENVQVENLSISGGNISMTCRADRVERVAEIWYQLDQQALFTSPYIGSVTTDETGIITFPVSFGLNTEVLYESK